LHKVQLSLLLLFIGHPQGVLFVYGHKQEDNSPAGD
jgi:hypothetical protein